jgi:hypothetical protein
MSDDRPQEPRRQSTSFVAYTQVGDRPTLTMFGQPKVFFYFPKNLERHPPGPARGW